MLGGTFNPPHLGHLHAAHLAKDALGLDQVLFIPTNIPPHKTLPEDTATAADRCRMVRLLTRDEPWARLDTIEIERGGASYTVDTLRALRARDGDGQLGFAAAVIAHQHGVAFVHGQHYFSPPC